MISRIGTMLRRLRRDRSGVAMLEFAFTLPVVLGVGGYGIEVANLALMNLKVSQIALALAENASRVGVTSSLSTQQLREVDINDIFAGVRLQGKGIDLTTRGRVILSSLENVQRTYSDGTSDAAAVQRIHWQRCIGLKGGTDYNSHYDGTTPTAGSDTTPANAGKTMASGMGDPGTPMVNAPPSSGVMFVEINYEVRPLFGALLMSPSRIHYIASFIVRDNRDFSKLFNPSPTIATSDKFTCDRYTT